MNFLALIEAKREGTSLSSAEIHNALTAFVEGNIPDYQMAAFLMAVYFRGLNEAETRALTLGMRDSGETLQFPDDPRPLVDKHSTGGVGDKVSLPLSPLLACLGFRVPMISGRGLGITGGTLDKLESIPGFTTALPAKRIVEIVQEIGCVICGQTDSMVPADKQLYALRDVTGTVPSIPLITASILSKKLAENLSALALDVKFGSAAFMPTLERARELARSMVVLGGECGVKTRALLTNMDSPLGRAAGNWLEVKEAVACLERATPGADDLTTIVVECAAHLLVMTGKSPDLGSAREEAVACLASGAPRRKWDEMLAVQGVNLEAFHQKLSAGPVAPLVLELASDEEGFVRQCDARVVGEVVRDLGGGRLTGKSVIESHAGVDALMKPGEEVARGDVLARVHASDEQRARDALDRLRGAFEITNSPQPIGELIREVV